MSPINNLLAGVLQGQMINQNTGQFESKMLQTIGATVLRQLTFPMK